jgi:hypothetical protein
VPALPAVAVPALLSRSESSVLEHAAPALMATASTNPERRRERAHQIVVVVFTAMFIRAPSFTQNIATTQMSSISPVRCNVLVSLHRMRDAVSRALLDGAVTHLRHGESRRDIR